MVSEDEVPNDADDASDELESDGVFDLDDDSAAFDQDDTSAETLEDWGGDELEAAYLKALNALEASEIEIPAADPSVRSTMEIDGLQETASQRLIREATARVSHHEFSEEQGALEHASSEESDSPPVRTADHTATSAEPEVPPFRPQPRQIIEACLFVGGTALSSTKLAGVLRGDFSPETVDREIDELNSLYAAEGRPYEIRLGEGGYRLTLREEYERIRHKVYGLGPKEVRISQEALEILAVVAYHQPIQQQQIEELGKPGCGPVLRQLVRRELIAVSRDPAQPKEVYYNTTPRFLSLFGIRNLDELPRHEQVSYK